MTPRLDRRDAGFLALLLAIAAPVYLWNWNAPFIHHWESHGALYSLHADNLLRFGTVPLDIVGPTLDNYPDVSRHYHINHPPLPQILLAAAFKLCGSSEASFRGLLTLFAFGGIVVLTALLRAAVDRTTAWTGAAIYAFMPLIAYYSTVNGQLAMLMFFAFLELLAYLSWRAGKGSGWLAVLVAAHALGCWIDWQMYYVPLVIAAHELWTRRAWRLGAALAGLNIAVFLSYLLFVHSLGEVESLFTLGHNRLLHVPVLDQLRAEGREIGLHMTAAATGAALLGLGLAFRRRTEEGMKFVLCLPLLGMDEILFREYVWEHDFLTYPLAAFFAALAAMGVATVARKAEWPRWARAGAVAVFAAAFIAQAALVLRDRVVNVGRDGMSHHVALAVRDVVDPADRVFVISRPGPAHLGFYAGCYVEIFDRESGLIARSTVGPRDGPFTLDQALGEVEKGRRRADWVVFAERERFLQASPSMAALPEPGRSAVLSWWYIDLDEAALIERLRPLTKRVQHARGFTFLKIK